MDEKLRALEELRQNMKPNPNHYPIVDKWNYRYVYKPNRFKIFKLIEETIDYMVDTTISPILEDLKNIKE